METLKCLAAMAVMFAAMIWATPRKLDAGDLPLWNFAPAIAGSVPQLPAASPIAWDFAPSPVAKVAHVPVWDFTIDTASVPSVVAIVPHEEVAAVPAAWNFTVSTASDLCDCEPCKCPLCTCGKPTKPREAEPTLETLVGHRLEYAKALEAAAKLKCQLIVTRGLDATETERWASEAERRKALFAVAKPAVKFDHDGAFRLDWHRIEGGSMGVGIVETLETKAAPIETVAMPAYLMPPVFPSYGGGCSTGNCPRR